MAAPTLITSYEVDSAASDTVSLVSPTFTPANGEVLVIKASSENFNSPVIGTISGGGQSYTNQADYATSNDCPARIYTAVISGSPGAMAVTLTFTTTGGWHSMVVERWAGARVAATPATVTTVSSGAPSTTVTTTANDSIVSWVGADWSAIAPGTPTYRSGAIQDGLHDKSTANYVAYYAYQAAPTAGVQTIGLTSPTGQKNTLCGIEILAAPSPIAAYGFNAMGTAGGTASVSSTINDDSGNGNTLVVQNSGMGIVTGHSGVGVEGDGSTYAQVADTSAIKPTTAVTWMCWARSLGNTYSWQQIFGRCNDDGAWGDAFSLYLNNDNRSTYGFDAVVTTDAGRTHGTNASTVLVLNTWIHIAATWSATDGNLRVFINGSEICSAFRDGTTLLYGAGGNTTRHFNIYQNEAHNERGSQIQIDDVRVFDKQLTATEITTWMNTSIGAGALVGVPWLTGINS